VPTRHECKGCGASERGCENTSKESGANMMGRRATWEGTVATGEGFVATGEGVWP
jgi:hypothetical protein